MAYASVADGILAEITALFPTPLSPPAPSDVSVYDGDVPPFPTNRYVVTYLGAGLRRSGTVDGRHGDLSNEFQVTCVAGSPDSSSPTSGMARWLQKRVRDRLSGLRLDVTGMQCGPIEHTFSRSPTADESVADRHVMFTMDEFQVQADLL